MFLGCSELPKMKPQDFRSQMKGEKVTHRNKTLTAMA